MRFLYYAGSECLSFYGFRSARLRDFISTKQKSNKQTSFRSVECNTFYIEMTSFHGPKGGPATTNYNFGCLVPGQNSANSN